jgi:dihydrofolate reductase/AcrR family transcriptional regulator
MASLVLKMSVSLDGYVAPMDGSTDWIAAGGSDDARSWSVETVSNACAHLVGAATYAVWAGYWPGASGPFAKPMNEIPKVVFSDSLGSAGWGETTIATGDLAEAITRLKRERSGGYLLAHGGVRFARSLVGTGLIDEYRLAVHPVVLGAGERIFLAPLTIEPVSTTVFTTSGVDAPAKEITDLAGVGVGTLYRHFPRRSDLVKAVVESGIDAVAEAGPALSAAHEPAEALTRWIHRFTELLATKRGLASALHSGDPAFAGLPGYFLQRLGPTLATLLEAAVADGTVRDDISAEDLLHAITQLSQPVPGRGPEHNQHIVAVLIDGLRSEGMRQPPAPRVS